MEEVGQNIGIVLAKGKEACRDLNRTYKVKEQAKFLKRKACEVIGVPEKTANRAVVGMGSLAALSLALPAAMSTATFGVMGAGTYAIGKVVAPRTTEAVTHGVANFGKGMIKGLQGGEPDHVLESERCDELDELD